MATSSPYPTHPSGPTGGYVFRPTRWWQRKSVRYGALIGLLAVSGLVILALVREQTGTEGFLVGLGLAVLPVPQRGEGELTSYVRAVVSGLVDRELLRQKQELLGRLQRTDRADQATFAAIQRALVDLEQERRALRAD